MREMDNSGINEPPKILLVEDDPSLVKTLSDALKAKGYRPIAVLTGEEGIEATKEHDLSLALIDLKLPDISGIEVLRGIKRNSPRTEAIIMTAYASLESAIEAVNLGAFSYLQKPYEMERLLLDILRALERKRMGEALRASEEFSSSLLNNSPNPIIGINPDTSVRYVNPAFEKLTGFSSAVLIGKKVPYPWWTEETLKKVQNLKKLCIMERGKLRSFFKGRMGSDSGLRYLLHQWKAVGSSCITCQTGLTSPSVSVRRRRCEKLTTS